MSAWIGNSCGFWGDRIDASLQLIQKEPSLEYLTLDYLSEMSLSIMAVQREKNPDLGFARDFIEVIETLIGEWNQGRNFKIVTNAGGLNPMGCAKEIKALLDRTLKRKLKIGIVFGDDVLKHFPGAATANAYVGAEPLIEALQGNADIVIAGRIADPSLTVACAAYHHQWNLKNYNLLAQSTVAGHLIECGAQATGGLMDDWLQETMLDEMGYPFVVIHEDGSFHLKKPEGTGGSITLRGVKEQLIYEMGNPSAYLSPDATVNLLDLQLEESGRNEVFVKGAIGKAPPSTYKVSTSLRRGWQAFSEIGLVGDQLLEKGKKIHEIIMNRLNKKGFKFDATDYCLLGVNGLSPYLKSKKEPTEAYLRIGVRGEDEKAVVAFTKELAPFITCGPIGVCAYATGRSSVRPLFIYRPALIERSLVKSQVNYLEAGCS